jgi:prepilin-type N-terminal cleavage/methylation domain-containing protein|uniref:Prepilin-type N-terminal cleavage/methylation domain-containing protein n=1 Tax=candidate division WOR-3 bacterium TaxID=2052148 RepID=A0A7V3NUV4_UNCW3
MRKGFTLVELAIVLIVIGLIIVIVLRGQGLVENARISKLTRDFQGIQAAFYSYYDRYGMYPGDDSTAGTRWPGEVSGNGNGYVDPGEAPYVWSHMLKGGYVQGMPRGPYGNYIFGSMNFGSTYGFGNFVGGTGIPGNIAEQIDKKNDDGIYNTGYIQGSRAYTSDTLTLYWKL